MTLLEKLREAKDFTPSEEALASYILQNPNKAFRRTIRELAENSFVSKPTIIRLYRKLGFDSYSDFRIAYFSEAQSSAEEVIDSNLPFQKNESPRDIAGSLCALTKQVVENNYRQLDEENLNRIVNTLFEANRIFIFAIGDAMIQAEAFKNKLIKLDIYPYLMNEYSDFMPNIYNLEKEDCVIVISFSGNTFGENQRPLAAIATSPAKTIVLSALTPNQIPWQFDYYLRLYGDENKFDKIATFSSQIAISYTLNLIYSCIYEKEYENNRKYTQKYVAYMNKDFK